MIQNAIEIRGLTKSFGKFRLGPLDLTVPRGSIYGFVGPNGAGKTTTLDLLLGMGSPDGGRILVDGLDHARDEVEVKSAALLPDGKTVRLTLADARPAMQYELRYDVGFRGQVWFSLHGR
jgi:ABC-type multidrug transport system ATPase subunit